MDEISHVRRFAIAILAALRAVLIYGEASAAETWRPRAAHAIAAGGARHRTTG